MIAGTAWRALGAILRQPCRSFGFSVASAALAQAGISQLPPDGEHVPNRILVGFRVPAEARLHAKSKIELETAGITAVEPLAGELAAELQQAGKLVEMRPLLTPVPPLANAQKLDPSQFPEVENPLEYVRIIELSPGTDLLATIQELEARPEVAYAEVDHIIRADLVPNDAQWNNSGLWGMRKIKADEAWDVTTGSTSIRVAIIDTGIDFSHPDLAGPRLINGFDFINGDSDATDDQGHGTHVAGTVGATLNNSIGVVGVAQCQLLAVKVLDAGGSGSYSAVANGISFAVSNGAKVLNLSLGGPSPDNTLLTALNNAVASGRLVVCASGNNNGPILYPAAYANAFAVGATDSGDVRASFSNFGPQLDVVAPGSSILSTTMGGGYAAWSGTSMATPHVSGSAALLWSVNPSFSNAQVEGLLRSNADDLGAPGRDDLYGNGRINLQRAFAALGGAPTIQNPGPLPNGSINVAYSPVALQGSGGYTPYAWRTLPLNTSVLGNTQIVYDASLDNREWRADEGVWRVSLPFGFPYDGTTYTQAWVSSNGFIDFAAVAPGAAPNNSPSGLGSRVRIAPLWDDLSTDGIINRPEDVYVRQPTPDSLLVVWRGHTFSGNQPVEFACTLFLDGRIRFDYGAGNTQLSPTIGLGFGDGQRILAAGLDGANTLTNAGSVLFAPGSLPRGMTLSSGGLISGTPIQGGQFNARVELEDAIGQTAQRSISLQVADPGTQPARILAMTPVPNNQIWSSKQPSGPFQQAVTFSENVNISAAAISVVGASTGVRPFTFSYDSSTFTATILMSGPLAEDTYTFAIDASQVTDSSGFLLDGEIVNGQLPSGNLVQGGNAVWTYTVMPWWREFRINSYNGGSQDSPSIAIDGAGNSVVVWTSGGQDGSGEGVYFQRYDSFGRLAGTETRANSYTSDNQSTPVVAMYEDGRFVVAWMSRNQWSPDSDYDTYVRRFAADGTPLALEVDSIINPNGFTGWPTVSVRPDGGFVCLSEDGAEIRGWVYDPQGVETIFLTVDDNSNPSQRPQALVLPNGRTVVAWQAFAAGNSQLQIRSRVYDPTYGTIQPDSGISGLPERSEGNASLVSFPDSSFTILWNDASGLDGSGNGIFARHWDAALNATGPFQINTSTSGHQYDSSGAASSDGRSVIVWTSQHSGSDDVYGARFDAANNRVGREFRVNTTTNGSQYTLYHTHNVVSDSNGNFIVVWTDAGGADAECRAQYFNAKPPTVLSTVPAPSSTLGPSSTSSLSVVFSDDVVITAANFSVTDDRGFSYDSPAGNPGGLRMVLQSYDSPTRTATFVCKNSGNATTSLPNSRQYTVRVRGDFNTGVYRRDPRPGITIGVDDFQVFLDGDWTDYSQPSGDGVEGGDAVWSFTVGRNQPWSGESRINQGFSGIQHDAVATGLRDDLFVAAWTGPDANGEGVFGARFDQYGYRIGGDFAVSQTTLGDQTRPSIDHFRDASFVVVWSGNGAGDADGVYLRKFSADGIPLSAEILVNQTTIGEQSKPDVAVSPDGQIFVVWQSFGQKGSGYGIWGRRFAEDLTPASDEQEMNFTFSGDQTDPAVAWLDTGAAIVVWQSLDGNGLGLFGQRFDSEGLLIGGELPLNNSIAGDQTFADVAALPGGGFMVAWQDSVADGNGSGIVARAFNASGVGAAAFVVNQTTSGQQSLPSIARLAANDLAIAWQSGTSDPTGQSEGIDIYQRRISTSTLAPLGNEQRVNTSLPYDQQRPAIGALSGGDFVVIWDGAGPFSVGVDRNDVYARWFDATPPTVTSTTVNANGNGYVTSIVLEFSEPVGVNFAGVSVVGQQSGSCPFVGSYDSHAWVATLTFAPPLSPDTYQLTLLATAAVSAEGGSVDGNRDRVGGDPFQFAFNVATPACPGDINGDRSTDLTDLSLLLAHFGIGSGATYADGDLNGDGAVNLTDLSTLLAHFGTSCN